jgi:hypothetical protein
MTRDDIIRMAREAGYGDALADLHAPALERFAELVAAPQREWQELTDEDVGTVSDEFLEGVLWAEAKLKAKNGF